MQDLRRLLDRIGRKARLLLRRGDRRDAVGLVPGGIGGQNKRRDLRRRAFGGGDGGRAVGGDGFGIRRGAHPFRHRPRQAFDIGGQRRVVADVIGRMLADDVDDAGMRLLGVVQVGKAVGETGAEMQQRRGRRALHAEIAVGRPGHHALEQAEHAAHALDAIERCDEMHLGGAGIGEADVDPARDQGPHQTFRTVHSFHSRSRFKAFHRPDQSLVLRRSSKGV